MGKKPLSERMKIREKQADITNGKDSPFITMDRQVWLDYADEVKEIEGTLNDVVIECKKAIKSLIFVTRNGK